MSEQLEAIEIETGAAPRAAVIWLHGLGADGHDFEPIVPELSLPKTATARFVFPHAPIQPVTINGGMRMRAWYDVTGDGRQDAGGIRASQALVEALIGRERARGIPSRAIVLAGFSQGGAIALQTALRHPERLAGVLALSTYLPLPDTLEREANPSNRDVPVFMAHGSQDPVIPLSWAARSRDALVTLGYAVEWHDYLMPHSVCAEEIGDISRWLAAVLP
ncbi:MAG TPA: alpha/beta fold hydrolase [Candidatus Bathyarchaeia archaeon]|nr:alpha/beta fold hydrolase [Candidatus Bathyarchaeia archaeon]